MDLVINILRFIDSAMDKEAFPADIFTGKNFHVSDERFFKTVQALSEDGYISGVSIKYSVGMGFIMSLSNVRLTVSGMRLLEEKK